MDVAVVGAGFAGLAAARQIVRARRSVVVLEARDRVGGRVLNQPIGGGEIVEAGGQWVGPTQDRILALARAMDVRTFATYNTGDNVYYQANELPRRQRYSASGPLGAIPPEAPGAVEAGKVIFQLNEMSREVPREAPWRAEQAEAWDSQTFETWKRENTVTESGRVLVDIGIEAVFAAEPRDLSLLFVLAYIAGAGNEREPGTFDRLINTGGGAQESRFHGGSQLVALRLAERLGRRVVLDSPVTRIRQSRRGVRIESERLTVTAHRVIVALPPALTGRIEYAPALPALRDQLIQRFPQGSVIKCHALYDRPFWRDEGLTGQAVSDAHPVRVTFDNSPPDGRPGVLVGFIEGHDARVWGSRSAAERRAAVLDNFAAYFGERARNPRQYYDKDWSREVWTRGCYEGYTPPGVLLDYGPEIRRPVGRIHWAGTETATIWQGYMDGAVRSGERAAREALASVPRHRHRRARRRRRRRKGARRRIPSYTG